MGFFKVLTGTYYVFAILFVCTFFYLLMEESKKQKLENVEKDLIKDKLDDLDKKVSFIAKRCGYEENEDNSDAQE